MSEPTVNGCRRSVIALAAARARFERAAEKIAEQVQRMIDSGSMVPDRADIEFVRAFRAMKKARGAELVLRAAAKESVPVAAEEPIS